MRSTSLVIRIVFALAGIVVLAAAAMMTSYWISDRADDDAYAINLAGSLRMQTYRLAFLTRTPEASEAQLTQAQKKLAETWQKPIFARLSERQDRLAVQYQLAYNHWQTVEPQVMSSGDTNTALQPALEQQILLLEELVSQIQEHAESNARLLRMVQVSALVAMLLLASVVVYWLRVRVERPLSHLTHMASRISQGDFTERLELRQTDELGILAQSFNRMTDAIGQAHQKMEEQIDTQTEALTRSNTTLQFLYDTAKTIIEQEGDQIDYEPIVSRLTQLVEADDIELCLITESGDAPYLQVKPDDSVFDLCINRNCQDCLTGELMTNANYAGLNDPVFRYSFPLMREQKHYGVLVCRMGEGQELALWQQQLMQSVADQLALALSLQAQEGNARRLALAHERTVIARELHDSLAQSLSYLKIQVARLNRALVKEDKATLDDVSTELHEGLNSAYRQLRELLTTFRLKVDGPGMLGALQTSVKQLSAQTDLQIHLHYHLENLPLTPNEEIHLLQIVREATQNALRHSEGEHVTIELREDDRKQISVSIEDDGIGVPDRPEKLNHYGLAIMQERSKNLGGSIQIVNRPEGGAGVYFTFEPECLRQRSVFLRE